MRHHNVKQQVFLDLRPGSTLGQLTANETAPDAAQEDKDALNGMPQLMNEATAVNRAFSQQVLLRSGERHECGQAHPFAATDAELDSMAGTAFRCGWGDGWFWGGDGVGCIDESHPLPTECST